MVQPTPIQAATRTNTISSASTSRPANSRTRRPTTSVTRSASLRSGTADPARQPVGQPVLQTPHGHPHPCLPNDRAAHLAPAERPLGERDGHLGDPGTGAHGPPGPVDLEAVALAGDVVEGQPVDQLGPCGPES